MGNSLGISVHGQLASLLWVLVAQLTIDSARWRKTTCFMAASKPRTGNSEMGLQYPPIQSPQLPNLLPLDPCTEGLTTSQQGWRLGSKSYTHGSRAQLQHWLLGLIGLNSRNKAGNTLSQLQKAVTTGRENRQDWQVQTEEAMLTCMDRHLRRVWWEHFCKS